MQTIHTTQGEVVLDGGTITQIEYYPGPQVLGEARLVDGKAEVYFPQETASDHSLCMCETCRTSHKGIQTSFEVAEILEPSAL